MKFSDKKRKTQEELYKRVKSKSNALVILGPDFKPNWFLLKKYILGPSHKCIAYEKNVNTFYSSWKPVTPSFQAILLDVLNADAQRFMDIDFCESLKKHHYKFCCLLEKQIVKFKYSTAPKTFMITYCLRRHEKLESKKLIEDFLYLLRKNQILDFKTISYGTPPMQTVQIIWE